MSKSTVVNVALCGGVMIAVDTAPSSKIVSLQKMSGNASRWCCQPTQPDDIGKALSSGLDDFVKPWQDKQSSYKCLRQN